MNQQQFKQFWSQLQVPLKDKWDKITTQDLAEIQGDLEKFGAVLQKRYGERQKEDVRTWAHRRYCCWSGNYTGYEDPRR